VVALNAILNSTNATTINEEVCKDPSYDRGRCKTMTHTRY
jgi:hypothetical protein